MTSALIPTEPIFLGERVIRTLFYAVPRNPGDPQTIIGTFTLMPGEDNIVLDAIKGEKGDRGDMSPFWRPQWGSTINLPVDLPDDLGDADAGMAWYIAGYWHVWDGNGWRIILGAIPGPPGPTPNLHMTARGVAPPSGGITYPLNLNVTPGGTTLEPTFAIDIPLIPGPKGDNAKILEADDFVGPIEDGQSLIYDSTLAGGAGGIRGGSPVGTVKKLSIPEQSFTGGTYGSTWNIVATLIVPGQPLPYYPEFDGHLRWKRSGLFNNAQIEVQVRALPQGSTSAPETGTLCARALYDPSTLDAETIAHVREQWSDTGYPARAIGPDSGEGRIPANTSMVYYVLLYRIGGSGSVVFSTPGAHMSLSMFPVS
ncbi:hypothetical protein [Mycobacteroides abscessus]|uniref:hypothetical protein n=1 Tax=Mycobacteroides abscessus TaxID=36809 RepID=UPI000C261BD8|nr:hypothetical protein [Mycobacteroides abscessus]